ncbi:MAG: sigma-54 dependent transcriptional regulator [Desulfovibrionaceae bacterium]
MISLRVLVVDDDSAILRTLVLTLKTLDCQVQGAESAEQALEWIRDAASPPFDMLLTDMRMGELSGVELVREVLAHTADTVCVVMTAFASYANAVSAIKAGAFDYLPKPFSTPQLEHVLAKVSALVALRRENAALRQALAEGNQDCFYGLKSPVSAALQALISRLAPSDVTLLLTGETGSGKTELARAVHRLSPRASMPFVEVVCTTLSEQLFETEVFGHTRGAFTGAVRAHKGKFESAQGGTVFLDEIGELSPTTQGKLLRFLEDKIIEKVGDTHPMRLDIRIIAATNQDLATMVREKRFREDLYYRLNMFECLVPPLRERREDIEPLALQLYWAALERYAPKQCASLPPELLHRLHEYDWPGNVRELRNVMERVALLSAGRSPALQDLPPSIYGAGSADMAKTAKRDGLCSLRALEEQHIRRALDSGLNMEQAAEVLGITTVTLWRKRKEFGMLDA